MSALDRIRAAVAPAPGEKSDKDLEASARPALRDILPELRRQQWTRRRRRIALWLSLLVAVTAGFGLVASHVILMQGQVQLQRLQKAQAEANDRQDRLRRDVAALESPSRIADEARRRLGMGDPDAITYVTPGGEHSSTVSASGAAAPTTTAKPTPRTTAKPASTPTTVTGATPTTVKKGATTTTPTTAKKKSGTTTTPTTAR